MNPKRKIFKLIESGDLESIKEILANHPELMDTLGEHNAYCRDKTPLMYAIQCLQIEIANWLIDNGADVDFQMSTGPKTPALSLCVDPYIPAELLHKMLSLGSNPNRYDHVGHTVAYVLIEHCATSLETNGLEKIKLLAKFNADFDYAPVPDEPDIDPMSAREYAMTLDDLSTDVANFLGIQKGEPKETVGSESENVILEYPDGNFHHYQTALVHGFKLILNTNNQDWIAVGVQGGSESSIVFETLPLHGRQLLFKFEKLNINKRNRTYPYWFSKIEKDDDGFCLLPADVTAEQLAELVDFICTRITKLPKFQGDYAIGFEYWPDFDYDEFKNSVENDE